MKQIVVLGAGYGGLLTAKKLAKKLKHEDAQVTIIDKNTYHTMLTELHEVACERVPEEAIRIDLAKVFAKKDVNLVHDCIQNIDFQGKVLHGTKTDYTFDYLVLGTGSKPTFFGTKGAAEYALTLWSYEDAIRVKNQIHDSFQKASVELDPKKRQQLLTFVVIGAGFTGIEMIGELAEHRNRMCHTYGIDPKDVNMYVADMLSKILPIFDDSVIRKAQRYVDKLGITTILNAKITEVSPEGVFFDGREPIYAKTAIWAAGIEGSDIMGEIEAPKLARNRVECDQYLHMKGREDVFVVGDNIFIVPEGEERPVPQMVENAEHSADTVSENITAAIKGTELHPYKPAFHGAMVCIGGKYGVAQLNFGKTKIHLSGFFAMFVKHFINMLYFMQVAGINKTWTYMIHEFFHVPDRRSFVGGVLSKRSSNIVLVPLRMFIGYLWLSEGLAKLPKVLADPSNIFLIPKKAAALLTGGADILSAATEAAPGATGEAANNAASAYGQALPVPGFIKSISDWFMDLMFYNADGGYTWLASAFQIFMVLAEIGIGICLIVGLFTFLSSIASIGLGFMIYVSGMAPQEMLWYWFGSLAILLGSGSVLGLDYWIIPWLKNWWKKTGFAKKWYLFTDTNRGY